MSTEAIRQKLQRVAHFVQKPAVRGILGGAVLALSLGYLGYILFRNWEELAAYDWQVNYRHVGLAFVFYSIALAFAVLGWSLIMGRMTEARNLGRHVKYYIYSNLIQRLPGPLLHLIGRAYLYEQEGISKKVTVAISLLEWILILLSGMLVYLLTLPLLSVTPVWAGLRIPLGVAVVVAVLACPRVIGWLYRLLSREELPIPLKYGDLLLWLLIYSLVWVGGGLVLYVAINSLYALSLKDLPAVIGVWALSGLISTVVLVTPVGLGLRELTLSVLLGSLIPAPLAVIVALLMRVGLTLFEIVWGLFALRL